MPRPKKSTETPNQDYFNKLESDLKSNQSTLSLVLGALIVLIVGVLIFNYFNKQKSEITPTGEQTQQEQVDVSPDKLPGKYTVKDQDTLFTIAEKYYKDGYKYTEIAKANNMDDPNNVSTGQILEIPKLEEALAQVSPSPEQPATGGAENATIWGPKIEGDSYTVVSGDWLSKIAGRAYGDIFAYQKIADANNISDPNVIEVGMVLKIPR